jgi:hypothetical protein
MYDTRVDRHACQLMLGEMQRRRPRGLVFHHTQPIREASPPPGTGRGAEMAAAALKKDAGARGRRRLRFVNRVGHNRRRIGIRHVG